MRPTLSLALLVLVAGCDSTEPSELGQWQLYVDLRDQLDGHEAPAHVLIGSAFDVALIRFVDQAGTEQDVSPDLAECVAMTATGSVSADGGEFTVAASGPGTVELAAPLAACPELGGDPAQLVADRWNSIGVDPALVNLHWSLWFEQVLADASAGPQGNFPSELGEPLDDARVAVGGTFSLEPALTYDFGGEPTEVRWSARDAELSSSAERLSTTREGEDFATGLFGVLEPDESVSANLRIADWNADAPALLAVDVDEITDLELVAVYGQGDEAREWAEPMGVIALARDAQGRRIVAPPVEWALTEGKLALTEPTSTDVSDVVYVDDICRERPADAEQRSATIEARLGDLVASTELEWTALPEGPEPQLDSAACGEDGCLCSASGNPGGSLGMLALVALGIGLRRRR